MKRTLALSVARLIYRSQEQLLRCMLGAALPWEVCTYPYARCPSPSRCPICFWISCVPYWCRHLYTFCLLLPVQYTCKLGSRAALQCSIQSYVWTCDGLDGDGRLVGT
jgi:hypothetical protein